MQHGYMYMVQTLNKLWLVALAQVLIVLAANLNMNIFYFSVQGAVVHLMI